MTVVFIGDQRIVGRGALRDLGDIPNIVVGILLPFKDRAVGADAHVAVLHLRRGLRNAACRAQILEGVGGRKERRAGGVFRCYSFTLIVLSAMVLAHTDKPQKQKRIPFPALRNRTHIPVHKQLFP